MIHVENGVAKIEGKGGHLIVELAIAINSIRDAFGDGGEEAIETALKMSEKDVMGMFVKMKENFS